MINKQKIVIKTDKGLRLIPVKNIAYIVAVNNYSKIILTNNDPKLIPSTLKEMEKQMVKFNFIRCHKSYLVNIAFIDEIHYKGKCEIILDNNVIIPVSRAKMKHIKEVLGIC